MKNFISLMLIFSVIFSQVDPNTGLELKTYKKAKIYYNTGGFVETKKVEDLAISIEEVSFTIGKERKTQQLSEISKIEVASGDDSTPRTCAGACVGVNALLWLLQPSKTTTTQLNWYTGEQQTIERDNPDKASAGNFLVGALLWGGISYFIGKGITKEMTKWEVIYERQN